ncbi:MAG: STAS domain-containing protein [Bryobacteraceae bacterium]|jgi:anti-sigma B factor antagonist
MSAKATVRKAGNVAIVDLAGRIVLGDGSGVVRETIKDLVGSGQNNILLNLRDVTYLDSSGLGEIVGSYATVTSLGGDVRLLHAQGKVKELLTITKLYTVFITYDNEAAALKAMAAGPAKA